MKLCNSYQLMYTYKGYVLHVCMHGGATITRVIANGMPVYTVITMIATVASTNYILI